MRLMARRTLSIAHVVCVNHSQQNGVCQRDAVQMRRQGRTPTLIVPMMKFVRWIPSLLLIFPVARSIHPLPQAEYQALYDFYNATNGEDWHWITGSLAGAPWSFTPDANPCTDNWQGVNCGVETSPPPATYHVIGLQLPHTNLQGILSSTLINLADLVVLELFENNLNGTLPSAYCHFASIMDVYLELNSLTGTIPECIGNLTTLQILDMHGNKLHGPIPSTLGSISGLQQLLLYDNLLTGRIPDTFSAAASMQHLRVSDNQLTGTIPAFFGNLSLLYQLDLNTNKFTGTIPAVLDTSLPELVYFGVSTNLLTGTIPSFAGSAARLVYLLVYDNYFTGELPQQLDNMLLLEDFYVNYNLLTGTIPRSLGYTRSLRYVLMNNNMLSSTVPASFGSLQRLFTLQLQSNRLSGPLDSVFNATQTALVLISLEGNQFTGTLPSVLFELPVLQSLSIVGSCMHGTLPSNICGATYLEALILYGLTTGTSCRAVGIQGMSTRGATFGGAFPSCLLSKPNMVTLLLSSNGLSGSIASNITVVNTLIELDLSHNDLTGSIPSNIQTHGFALLDLSHNKLSGVLQPNLRALSNASALFVGNASTMSPGQIVSLSSNRLSGPVPSSLMPLHNNLSVLAGNLFECRYDKSNLPQHDSDISNYQCASNSFDIAIYVWLGLAVCAAVVAGTVWYTYNHQINWSMLTTVIRLPDALSTRLAHLHTLTEQYHSICKCAWYCAAFCVLVLLPYYAIVSHYEGTHTHQYAYVLSAIYVSGVTPFVCDFVLLLIALMVLVCCVALTKQGPMKWSTRNKPIFIDWRRIAVWCVFAFTNIIVVLGANMAFVYTVLYQSSQVQTLAQILLSLFKLGWSMWVAPNLIRNVDTYMYSKQGAGTAAESYFTLQLLVSLFNNIAIPCLVVAAIDPNCFSGVLLPPKAETVWYLLPYCEATTVAGTCLDTHYSPTALQFTPPFTYSYQCSASFITSYAPTFIYMSMSTVFLSLLLQYVLLGLHQRLPAGSTVHKPVSRFVPRILRAPSFVPPKHGNRPIVKAVGILVTLLTQLGILVTLLTQLGILLTFGAIFPPVVLAMAVSISAVVFMTRYKAQRYVHAVVETQHLAVLDMINAECERVGTREQMRTAVVIIICYCCAFYAMFLFDTLGDAVGFDASVWVLIVVLLTPVAIFSSARVHSKYFQQSDTLDNSPAAGLGLELAEVKDVRSLAALHAGINIGSEYSTESTVNILHDGEV